VACIAVTPEDSSSSRSRAPSATSSEAASTIRPPTTSGRKKFQPGNVERKRGNRQQDIVRPQARLARHRAEEVDHGAVGNLDSFRWPVDPSVKHVGQVFRPRLRLLEIRFGLCFQVRRIALQVDDLGWLRRQSHAQAAFRDQQRHALSWIMNARRSSG